MTLKQALDIVIAQDHHERWRELCDESYPDHVAYRDLIMRKASGEQIPDITQHLTEAAQQESGSPRLCCGQVLPA